MEKVLSNRSGRCKGLGGREFDRFKKRSKVVLGENKEKGKD